MVYIFFFILVVPICILLHEIGHGIGAITTSSAHVHIYLGMKTKSNKENFNLGRMHFHIQWSFIGFAYWGEGLSRRQKAIALAGGPIMSLLLAILFGIIALLLSPSDLRALSGWTAIFNLIQFIVTTIPVTYPRWMGGYNGLPSDGLQLIQVLKD